MESLRQAMNSMWNLAINLSFWDILDIIIVAFIIYKLITFVSKTSSGSVVKGIIVLIAVMWLSSILKLNVINYLLGQAMELGVLIIVILFQPELRKFLEQMGSKNFLGVFGKQMQQEKAAEAIGNTVIACTEMSKSKTGALIVFEREIKANEWLKTGTMVDSLPSVELIKNIFYPKSPLHDGAVVVRSGRILAAGCMLPMSENTNLSRDLGMRHRAGIGMSEKSDAVVVIVSEETGSISVAIKGMLKRHLSHDTFEKLLRNELMADDQNDKKSVLRKHKRKNNG